MVEKETVGVRLAPDKIERIERLAEEKDITKSDATRRLIDKGIDFQDSGIDTLITQKEDSDKENPTEPITDGGSVVRNTLNLMVGFYASITLSLFLFVIVSIVTGVELAYSSSFTSLLIVAVLLTSITLVPLYTDLPERVDNILYSRMSDIPGLDEVVA